MRFVHYLAPLVCASLFCVCLLESVPAAASHLVTGNGFGFAVVSPETATVSKFYAHPYSFVRPDTQNPLSEGVATANFIKELGWRGGSVKDALAEYEQDSQVIHARKSDGEGFFFMPFGLRQTALIVSWEPGSAETRGGGLYVEWSWPVKSQRAVRMFGANLHLLKFDGIEESLLLIPLGRKRAEPGQAGQILATSLAWALVSLERDSDLEQTVKQINLWRAGLAPHALAKREIAEIERWRV